MATKPCRKNIISLRTRKKVIERNRPTETDTKENSVKLKIDIKWL